jgi:hypothetical protein
LLVRGVTHAGHIAAEEEQHFKPEVVPPEKEIENCLANPPQYQ